ncbi:hypothetical protein CcI49_29010 [Frankia sp. CcI49]|nr:hypothetical protein CcI49_29010 [Frankia sp. CcI49]
MSSHNTPDTIAEFICNAPVSVIDLEIDYGFGPLLTPAESGASLVEGFYRFETEDLNGRGHVRLMQGTDGGWRAWTVLTEGRELKGRPLAVRHRRPSPSGRATEIPWHIERARLLSYDRPDPQVVIVGGAQNGLGLAATLGLMGVDALVIDKSVRVGDVWRNRYESLVLHAPVYSDHLPHFPFPENWPVYSPARKYADWLESYSKAMEINVWNSCEVLSAAYDETSGKWTIAVHTPEGERTLHPGHLVVATGSSSEPLMPTFPGQNTFKGSVIHSNEHQTGQGWDGRKVVVIGAGTSAHDVAEDFYHGGADVAMVQRSPTYVCSRDNGNKILFESAYSEDAPPLEYSDLRADSIPWPLLLELAIGQTEAIAAVDRAMLDGLERANFKVIMGDPEIGDRSGLMACGARPGGPGGYYINQGASDLIIEGKIAIHAGVGLDHFTEEGVVLTDGTELQADRVILATGYRSMRDTSRKYLGDKVVDQTETFYGITEFNERGLIHQPSGYPHLWYAGGGIIEVRRYGTTLALQIAAQLDGLSG